MTKPMVLPQQAVEVVLPNHAAQGLPGWQPKEEGGRQARATAWKTGAAAVNASQLALCAEQRLQVQPASAACSRLLLDRRRRLHTKLQLALHSWGPGGQHQLRALQSLEACVVGTLEALLPRPLAPESHKAQR